MPITPAKREKLKQMLAMIQLSTANSDEELMRAYSEMARRQGLKVAFFYDNKEIQDHFLKMVDGLTPKKGVHYFTPEEIKSFLQATTPKKGTHYFDGIDGKDGKDGKSIKGEKGDKGDKGDAGIKPIRGIDYFTQEDISYLLNQVLGQIKHEEIASKVIGTLKEKKGKTKLSIKDLQDHEFVMGRLLRGGGDTVTAGANITITTDANGHKVITGTAGGSLSILAATGAINGSNTAFTFVSKPTLVISDGISLRENNGWTWNAGLLTATLSVAPTFDVYAIG